MEDIGLQHQTPEEMRSLCKLKQIAFVWLQGLDRWPETILRYDSRLGGLGWLWLIGCMPASAYALARCIRPRHHATQCLPLLILVAVVAAGFSVTPLNWWARFTIWIYGLGLPCFSLALTRVPWNSPRFHVSRLWATTCVLLAMSEAAYLASDLVRQAFTCPVRSGGYCTLRAREYPPWIGYLNLRDPLLREMLMSDDSVAVGFLRTDRHTPTILGMLCQPVGKRLVVSVSSNCSKADLRYLTRLRVRYIIWDDGITVPALIRDRYGPGIHLEPGLWVFTLNDPFRGDNGQAEPILHVSMYVTGLDLAVSFSDVAVIPTVSCASEIVARDRNVNDIRS